MKIKPFLKGLFTAGAVAAGLLSAQPLWASTAANTNITNTVTVNYANAAGVAQTAVTASTTITVNLVQAAPTVAATPATSTAVEGQVVAVTYTVTSNANGPDSYSVNLASVDTSISAPGFTAPTTPVTLGGTTLATAVPAGGVGPNTTITVPSDQNTADGIVNGIAVGDTIVIGGTVYPVTAVTEGATTTAITVTGIVPATAAGTLVGEQLTITANVTTGTVSAGTSGTHALTLTINQGQATQAAATHTITVNTTPALVVTKYVRNVTAAVVGGGTSITANGATYYTTGVSGKPGDVLEYLIVAANTAAGAQNVQDVQISDPIPQFTSYVAASMKLDSNFTAPGTFVAMTDTQDDGDAAEVNPAAGTVTDVRFYAGVGGADTTAGFVGTGGTVAANASTAAIFQVTIQ